MSDPAVAYQIETKRDGAAPAQVTTVTPGADSLLPYCADLAAGHERFIVARAHGSRLFDAEGRSYIDLCMGFGSMLLGHGATAIKDALVRQIDNGWMYGISHRLQDELASLIHSAGPANVRVSLCNSESDASLLALRAARAFTSRDRIAVFTHSHHGLHDFALITETTRAAPGAMPSANDASVRRRVHIGAGIPAGVDDFVIVLPFGERAAIEWVRSYAGQLAAVIVEPVSARAPSLVHGEWLRLMQKTCRENEICFILDETFTGFRLRYGGAQELFGLEPDLVTYGNALGGGLSIGAIAGRADIMAAFGPAEREKRIFSGTTHAGNPLSVAAAVATLNVLFAHRDEVYPQLNDAAASLVRSFNAEAENLGAQVRLEAAGSMFRINFPVSGKSDSQPAWERDFYRRLFERHVIVHASGRCFLSTAHTVADIAEVSKALSDSLRAVIG